MVFPSFVKASLISPIVKFTLLGILELIKVYKSLKKSRKEQQATSFQLVDKGLTFGSQPWAKLPIQGLSDRFSKELLLLSQS